MTINLALEYIPRRMAELGHEGDYYLRFRHLVLHGGEKQDIEAYNQLYILVEETPDISISSELGLFDLNIPNANEMQYEHQGQIRISSYASEIRHVKFIQIITKTCKQCPTA